MPQYGIQALVPQAWCFHDEGCHVTVSLLSNTVCVRSMKRGCLGSCSKRFDCLDSDAPSVYRLVQILSCLRSSSISLFPDPLIDVQVLVICIDVMLLELSGRQLLREHQVKLLKGTIACFRQTEERPYERAEAELVESVAALEYVWASTYGEPEEACLSAPVELER
jgi:hypothetical protein